MNWQRAGAYGSLMLSKSFRGHSTNVLCKSASRSLAHCMDILQLRSIGSQRQHGKLSKACIAESAKKVHHVVIVGAGLYGLTSAFYLAKYFIPTKDGPKKLEITIVDSSSRECQVASRLNGAALCFGLVKSWPQPSIVSASIKDLCDKAIGRMPAPFHGSNSDPGLYVPPKNRSSKVSVQNDDGLWNATQLQAEKYPKPDLLHIDMAKCLLDWRFWRFCGCFLWNALFRPVSNDVAVGRLAKLAHVCGDEIEDNIAGGFYDAMSVTPDGTDTSESCGTVYKGTVLVNVPMPTPAEEADIAKRGGVVVKGVDNILQVCPSIDPTRLETDAMIVFPNDKQGDCGSFGERMRAWLENFDAKNVNATDAKSKNVSIKFRFSSTVMAVDRDPDGKITSLEIMDCGSKEAQAHHGSHETLSRTDTISGDSFIFANGANLGFFLRKHALMRNLPIYPLHGCVIDCRAVGCDLKQGAMVGGVSGLVIPLSDNRLRISAGVVFHPTMCRSAEESPLDMVGIRNYVLQYFQMKEAETLEFHTCARPVIADDVPAIGMLAGIPNAYVCGGGGSKGWTLVPACGALMGALLLDDIHSVSLGYSPDLNFTATASTPAGNVKLWDNIARYLDKTTVHDFFTPQRFSWLYWARKYAADLV